MEQSEGESARDEHDTPRGLGDLDGPAPDGQRDDEQKEKSAGQEPHGPELGADADFNRAIAIAVGAFLAIGVVGVSAWFASADWAMVPYGGARYVLTTIIFLTIAMVIAIFAADGAKGLASLWGSVTDAFTGRTSVPPSVGRFVPTPKVRFIAMLAAVIVLAGALILLVADSGGVMDSPFLQLLLVYFICGILVADERPTRLIILGLSVATPIGMWIAEGHLYFDTRLDGQYHPGDVAVMTAVATSIAGVVNFMTRDGQ